MLSCPQFCLLIEVSSFSEVPMTVLGSCKRLFYSSCLAVEVIVSVKTNRDLKEFVAQAIVGSLAERSKESSAPESV